MPCRASSFRSNGNRRRRSSRQAAPCARQPLQTVGSRGAGHPDVCVSQQPGRPVAQPGPLANTRSAPSTIKAPRRRGIRASGAATTTVLPRSSIAIEWPKEAGPRMRCYRYARPRLMPVSAGSAHRSPTQNWPDMPVLLVAAARVRGASRSRPGRNTVRSFLARVPTAAMKATYRRWRVAPPARRARRPATCGPPDAAAVWVATPDSADRSPRAALPRSSSPQTG